MLATYRLQLPSDGGLAGARELVPYLAALGVSHLYASPVLAARSGSTHGYDVTDPTRINPELGSPEELDALAAALAEHGLGLLLDIVPNHMAASVENPWWADLLQHGPASEWADCFDVTWEPFGSPVQRRLFLPILGKPYGQALEAGELRAGLERGVPVVRYWDTVLPLDPRTWADVLDLAATERPGAGSALAPVAESLRRLPGREPGAGGARREGAARAQAELAELAARDAAVHQGLDAAVARLNGRRGVPASFDRLDRLLEAQAFRLAYWRIAREKLNYRRFFNIPELAGLRAEDPRVFDASHGLVLRLVAEGKVQGLRIDHVDGLADPGGYLDRLAARLPAGFPVLVEKILMGEEQLPSAWPVAGTTGYELAAALALPFVHPSGLAELAGAYGRFVELDADFADIAYSRKRYVMQELFQAEMRSLEHRLARLAEADRHARDLPASDLTRALVEVTACLPVYRTYTRDLDVRPEDRAVLERALAEARRRAPGLSARALGFVARLLLAEAPPGQEEPVGEARRSFLTAWQQTTGPITAKGIEDTAFYVYNRLVALNEVGGEPDPRDLTPEAFHAFNGRRRERWSGGLAATSTHDTKRGEDVRARLVVLTEMAGEWEARVQRWRGWNERHAGSADGERVPDANAEYLLYQTLVGAWPLDPAELPAFRERVAAYMQKARREAKSRTSWTRPNAAYEAALDRFVAAILDDGNGEFLADLGELAGRVAFFGAANALAQLTLKLAVPGVPDFYRGTELWDLALVDPDNRRPVDFGHRRRLLDDLAARPASPELAAELLATWWDGRAKLHLTHRGLLLRREHPEPFAAGDYVPLAATGARAEHLLAFARHDDDTWVVAAVPRLVAGLTEPGRFPLGAEVWGDTRLALPSDAPEAWTNVLTGESLQGAAAADLFRSFPAALLVG